MSIAKIQKGDKVKVIAGKYKGTIGVVQKVIKKLPKFYKKNTKPVYIKRVLISEIPGLVKYRKPMVYQGESIPGQMTSKPRSIHISNVALVMNDKGDISKIKIQLNTKGGKQRVYKKNGKIVVKANNSKDKKIENKKTKEDK